MMIIAMNGKVIAVTGIIAAITSNMTAVTGIAGLPMDMNVPTTRDRRPAIIASNLKR
jgi:hypothetical protein